MGLSVNVCHKKSIHVCKKQHLTAKKDARFKEGISRNFQAFNILQARTEKGLSVNVCHKKSIDVCKKTALGSKKNAKFKGFLEHFKHSFELFSLSLSKFPLH